MPTYINHIDDTALATGTHTGSDGAGALYVKNFDFRMYGARVGLAIHNNTQSTDGLITAVDNEQITDDSNSWNKGDSFSIYKTSAKDTPLSRFAVDRGRGWKVTDPKKLDDRGWFVWDRDTDGKRYPGSGVGISEALSSDDTVFFKDSDDVSWGDGFSKAS